MARQRNKTSYLPFEQRQIVMAGLLDGLTREEIRAQLAAVGVPEEQLPSIKAIGSYADGPEYERYRDEMLAYKRRAEEKRLMYQAVEAGGGADALADLAVFEALNRLFDQLRDPDSDAGRTATAIGQLKRVLLADADAQRNRAMDDMREQHAAEASRYQAEIAKLAAEIDRMRRDADRDRSGDRSAIIDAMDEFVRGPK